MHLFLKKKPEKEKEKKPVSPLSTKSESDASVSHQDYLIKFSELTFTEQKKLGAGGFGAVKAAKWNGTDVAVKQIPKDNSTSETTFKNEVALLTSLHHPNIVQLFCYCEKPDCYLMVMELVHGGDLQKLIHDKSRPLELPLIIEFCLNICRGMIYLHKRDILHRDLKPANILVTNADTGQIKITDFGLSRQTAQDLSLTSHFATPLYAAPEISSRDYDSKVDVFSFAIIMWEMFSRELPWLSEKFSNVVVEKVRKGERPSPFADRCPKQFRKLIESCWASNPKKRPTFEQIHEQIEKTREELKAGNIVYPSTTPSSSGSLTSRTTTPASLSGFDHTDLSDSSSKLVKQSDHDLFIKSFSSADVSWTSICLNSRQYLNAAAHDLDRIKYLFDPPHTQANFIFFTERYTPFLKEKEQPLNIYETNDVPADKLSGVDDEDGYRISEIADIVSPSYFHGFMQPKESEMILENEDRGTFIIRFSSNKNFYALDAKDDTVRHWRVDRVDKYRVALPTGTVFESFQQLITHYTKEPLLNLNGTRACCLTHPHVRKRM
eukprot:TRINITY_DN1101_c0_g1_i1.p1 TRINITY_DN1101_c0_g1~~TRINITY_DN1101_c0_g1_i1.p1  ORF type:complete len:550 (+),score=66.25 TRINITY_DN1101_c0_g1_i1:274-1923(+)